jgi:hypothetical protein
MPMNPMYKSQTNESTPRQHQPPLAEFRVSEGQDEHARREKDQGGGDAAGMKEPVADAECVRRDGLLRGRGHVRLIGQFEADRPDARPAIRLPVPSTVSAAGAEQ